MTDDNAPREYRYLDPDNLDVENAEVHEGTNAQCLADAALDIFQVGVASGMTEQDVDEAMRIITDYRAKQVRKAFRLHIRKEERPS